MPQAADANSSPEYGTLGISEAAEPSDPDALVDIPDAALRRALEAALGKEEDAPITRGDMAGLVDLKINGGVDELTGLEHAINLVDLVCDKGGVTDLTPLAELRSLTQLSLQFNVISDIGPLSELDALTSLYLHGNVIADVVPLAKLVSLTELYLGDNDITDIRVAAELRSLTRLSLRDNAVSDITPLAELRSLTYLGLDYNAIADIAPLAELGSLTWLNLSYNAISDITPVAELRSLWGIFLHGNPISDTAPLSGLEALNALGFGDNGVADVAFLAELRSLTWLWLRGNAIADVHALAGLEALETLNLSDNVISDIAPLVANDGLGSGDTLALEGNPLSAMALDTDIPTLQGRGVEVTFDASEPLANEPSDPDALVDIPDAALQRALEKALGKEEDAPITRGDMAGLTGLTIDGCVNELTGLEHAINLVYLVCKNGGLSDLTPLAGLESLTSLSLRVNAISDVAPLAGLRSLTRLHLSNNAISDLAPLANLELLTTLSLDYSNSSISDLGPLAGLSSMTSLSLSGNVIFDVAPLAGLELLTNLYLGGNAISDIAPLAGLEALTGLDLALNGISDISPLAELGLLRWLSLNRNAISDIAPLVSNDGLGGGDSLGLEGNPLSAKALNIDIPTLQERGVKVAFDAPVPLAEGDRAADIPDPAMRTVFERVLNKGPGWPIGVNEIAEITELNVRDSHIEDLAGIEHATDLEYLDLGGNAVTDLALLGGLESLQLLYLDGNEISDIAALAELPLAILSLSDTKVGDFSALSSMDSLYWLALDGNAIHDLPPLPASLRYLYVTNNAISDIGVLASLPRLREARLSGNSIRSLAPLAGLAQLEHVFLNGNRVRDLAPLNLESLVELHLRNNRIRNIESVRQGQLAMVDLRGNPLAEASTNVHAPALREDGTAVLMGRAVPYFPAAGGSNEGFVRVVNRSGASGDVFIEAVDDAGVRFGPESLRLGARRVLHFDSGELQNGHAGKGFAGIGPPTVGDWRLEVASVLDIEVLSYVRSEDSLVTPMHDIAREAGHSAGGLPSFGVFDSAGGGSILRVVNTEAERARWTTGGYDDRGYWRAMANAFVLPGGSALTFTAEQLANAHGLRQGSWQLRVRGFPWFAQNLYMSPAGHLANLSTAPANGAELLADGTTRHRVPFLPAAAGLYEGLVRVVNRSAKAGEATIEATDDEGNRFGPSRLSLDARQAVLFSSADLEHGNDAKGLAGAVGPGEGDWRLALTSALELQVLSYVRSEGGFVSAMHDLAPVATDGSHRVVYFNPASNRRHVSKLRLVNDGEQTAAVTITGIDDRGAWSETVTLTVPAISAATFTSAQLEAGGEGLAGSLGDGYGKWRLRVESDVPLAVMSLVESRDGHLVNVSTGTAD